jgi:hypothetical protein
MPACRLWWFFALLPLLAAEPPKGAQRLVDIATRAATNTPAAPPPADAPIRIQFGPWHGWPRAVTLSNGVAEVVIVPEVGRVMQFRLRDEPGVFWDDPALYGKSPDPASAEWLNFGGDKTWPAPQADWPKVTPRAWPPPVAFDALPVEASVFRDGVLLRSPVDPHYGLRTERLVRLDRTNAVMTIETTYVKEQGPPSRVGVWIITQLHDPEAVFIPLPRPSINPAGYVKQSEVLPPDLKIEDGLISLRRHPTTGTKIGTDAETMLWVGKRHVLRIDSPRLPGLEYPDENSSAEVYTNGDPKTYVELETLGPLATLNVGNRLSQTNTYTLLPRTQPTPRAEARAVLGR